MGSILLAVIMKCLILLTIASSVLGYGGPGHGAAALHGQHYGAGLLAHQYGAALPYNYPAQATPASVEDTPASAVRLPAPSPFTGYGHAVPYGYAGTHGHGYPGYAYAGYGPAGYANGPPGYGYPGAYQRYTGWPYAAAPVAAAAAKSE